MISLEVLREQVATRLNGIRCRRTLGDNKAPDMSQLFGPARPLGRYDGDIFGYFTGASDVHPILPLTFLRRMQDAGVASEVLSITLDEIAAELDDLPAIARTRVELWRAAEADSSMALLVNDEVAYSIMRPALDYMSGHHAHSNYKTGVLVGQIVAWCLGDPLMDRLPTLTFKLEVGIPDHIREEYEKFVVRFLRTVYETRQLPLHDRVAPLVG